MAETEQIALDFDRRWAGPTLAPGWDEWTEIVWTNGRTYRYRLDTTREYGVDLAEYADRAPPSIRWELSVKGDDGQWREVRNWARRDEIWTRARPSQEDETPLSFRVPCKKALT